MFEYFSAELLLNGDFVEHLRRQRRRKNAMTAMIARPPTLLPTASSTVPVLLDAAVSCFRV